MTSTAIQVRNLGKRYRIGTQQRSDTLVGALSNALLYPIRNLRNLQRLHRFDADDEATVKWALRDVSFEVREGEVLGLIGHNGAGKSTLLKILSRITEPSTGSADLRGRVSSLLEVGTGFHQELTGRDNVYMNGTILGMRAAEVRAKFDEIVAFSGVEQYIDTPVKFYSSGMKVRLAFAVAAHLDPEILLIDEVLAVGDLAFQQKCLGKMDAVSKSGRTILFVSHNMSAVEGLCGRCILMDGGRVSYDGTVEEAVERYRTQSLHKADHTTLLERTDRDGNGRVRFSEVRVNPGGRVLTGEPLTLEIDYEAQETIPNFQVAIKISRNYRDVLMTIDSRMQGVPLEARAGRNTLRVDLPRFELLPGRYLIDLWGACSTTAEDRIFNAATLRVEEHDVFGTGMAPRTGHHGYVVSPVCEWHLN